MCDYRTLSDTSTVRVTPAHMGSVKLAFGGINSHGNPITVTVVMPWWLWPLLAKEAAQAWVVEKAKRIREIGILNRSFISPEEWASGDGGGPAGGSGSPQPIPPHTSGACGAGNPGGGGGGEPILPSCGGGRLVSYGAQAERP